MFWLQAILQKEHQSSARKLIAPAKGHVCLNSTNSSKTKHDCLVKERSKRRRKPKVHFDVSSTKHVYPANLAKIFFVSVINLCFTCSLGVERSLKISKGFSALKNYEISWPCSSNWLPFCTISNAGVGVVGSIVLYISFTQDIVYSSKSHWKIIIMTHILTWYLVGEYERVKNTYADELCYILHLLEIDT